MSILGDRKAVSPTSVITTSVNNAPVIANLPANQAVNDNVTLTPLSAITVTDPDTQNLFVRVTIFNGLVRGDFTPATTAGWNRKLCGNDIRYERFYPLAQLLRKIR